MRKIATLIHVIIIIGFVFVFSLFLSIVLVSAAAVINCILLMGYSPNLHRTSLSNSSFFAVYQLSIGLDRERNKLGQFQFSHTSFSFVLLLFLFNWVSQV